MQTLTLEVTIDEANLILEALGQRPFIEVYQLVQKIQSQAEDQVNQTNMLDDGIQGEDGD